MPIEIRELNIRVSVSAQQPQETAAQAAEPAGNAAGKAEIIAECIEQVLEILHKQQER